MYSKDTMFYIGKGKIHCETVNFPDLFVLKLCLITPFFNAVTTAIITL